MKALLIIFLTLRGHSSVHVQNTKIVSFFMFFFNLMGILIVFMGDIISNIFYQ